jgi:hypothetical protein
MRRNPLLFNHEEYEFLHKIYLAQQSSARVFLKILKKKGVGLGKEEILTVKKKFVEWKLKNPNELWMETQELN